VTYMYLSSFEILSLLCVLQFSNGTMLLVVKVL